MALVFDPTISVPATPMSISDAGRRRHVVADQLCEALQRSRAELLNVDWRCIVHPDDLKAPTDGFAHLMATGKPFRTSARLRRGDGLWTRIHVDTFRIATPTGYFAQASATFDKPEPDVAAAIPNDEDALDYLQDMATQLAKLAARHRLDLLQQFLAMASHEAAEELASRLARGARVESPLTQQ